jgi:hypothetical protein
MLLRLRLFVGALAIGLLFFGTSCRISGQQPGPAPVPVTAATLPDAPQAQPAVPAGDPAMASSVDLQASSQTSQASLEFQSTPASAPAQSSGPQAPAAQPAPAKTDREKAEEQLKEQEHQRVAGVMATFNTTRNRDALPLSPSQKFRLFFKSSTDPWPFLLAGVVSGIGQINNSPPEWGQGLKGYAKRFGGDYADAFIGNFFGNAVLPVMLKEDPRYFQKGTGSAVKRVLWAASSTFWCRRDNGKWGPNYANVGGNLIGSAIARAYYPESERNVHETISDGLTVSVEGIAGAEVIEFWPDIARMMKRKHDEKMARKAAQMGATGTKQPEGKRTRD